MPSGHRPQPPTNACRLAISGIVNNQPWANIFYLNMPTDGTYASADLKSVIDAVMTSWATNVKPQHSTSVTTQNAQAVWITGAGTALEYTATVSQVGTNGTAVQDNSASAVVNWAINQYYRGGHPRTYVPAPPAGNISNGNVLTGAFQTALATAFNSWMTAVNALTATHVTSTTLGTVSFARGNVWRSPPVFYKYQNASVRNYLGTQRRRIGGR